MKGGVFGVPLNYRRAVRLIRQQGGRFVRHGSRHDAFEMPDGTEVILPKHPRDYSVGVENDILRRIGLK